MSSGFCRLFARQQMEGAAVRRCVLYSAISINYCPFDFICQFAHHAGQFTAIVVLYHTGPLPSYMYAGHVPTVSVSQEGAHMFTPACVHSSYMRYCHLEAWLLNLDGGGGGEEESGRSTLRYVTLARTLCNSLVILLHVVSTCVLILVTNPKVLIAVL